MKERIINLLEERKVAVILLNTPVKSPKGDIISLGQNTVGYYAVNNPHLQFQFYEDLDQTILIKLIEEATALPQSRQFRRRNLDGSYNDIWEDMAEPKTWSFLEQLLPGYNHDSDVSLSNDLSCVLEHDWTMDKFLGYNPQFEGYSQEQLLQVLEEIDAKLHETAEEYLQEAIKLGEIEVREFSVRIVSARMLRVAEDDCVSLVCADETLSACGTEFTILSSQLQNVKSRWLNDGEDSEQFQIYCERNDSGDAYWCNAQRIDFE